MTFESLIIITYATCPMMSIFWLIDIESNLFLFAFDHEKTNDSLIYTYKTVFVTIFECFLKL
jgi:hypothetical protein